MWKILIIIVALPVLAACNNETDESGNMIANPNFQRACIDAGGTVYPTRYGLGGCMIEGFSYSQVNGVRIID